MRASQLSITGEEVSIVMTMNRFMKKLFSMFLALALIIGYTAAYPLPADAAASGRSLGPVTSKDVIYQILTDRFYDGDPANNIPPGTPPELFNDDNGDGRGDGTDLNKYQGGDWKGIQEKIPYLKNMGITAVWISAPYENRENLIAGMYASYHGYHARNYFAANPHFGKMQDFTALVDALHDNGIKVVIDFVTNHSGPRPDGDGVLYEPDRDSSGQYVFDPDGNPIDYNGDGKVENRIADIHNDMNGFFHHEGDRPDSDTSQFGYRHKELASLADYSQENGVVIEHLEKAGKFWKAKGIDGFRHDATLHMNPAFVKGFKEAIDSDPGGPVTHFGEFFIGRPDPKYDEYRPGNTVYIHGTGLGGAATVAFGSQQAAVVSAQDNRIAAVVPIVPAGDYAITVTKGGKTSNPFRYQVLGGDQVQVIFHINKATQPGQNVYVIGDIAELGGWNPDKALDSFMNPNYPEWFLPVSVPAGATFQFKFFIKDAAGYVTWEGGTNRLFTGTSNPTGTSDTPVYTWQP